MVQGWLFTATTSGMPVPLDTCMASNLILAASLKSLLRCCREMQGSHTVGESQHERCHVARNAYRAEVCAGYVHALPDERMLCSFKGMSCIIYACQQLQGHRQDRGVDH